jgi:hypothetical protein
MNIHATVERAEPNGANLQRFLIMRIGRPVHAAEAIGAGPSQQIATIRLCPARDRTESANVPVVMLKRARPFCQPKIFC